MSNIHQLLANNAAWAAKCLREDPDYFTRLAKLQRPSYLWIGCSDARVPANTIVGLNPGEVFVHRNVANQVMPSDLNCLSVIQFAVEILQVKDIIVCGHYGCGGIQSILSQQSRGVIDRWLSSIKNLYLQNQKELDALMDLEKKSQRLCEMNLHQQLRNVCETSFVQEAWKQGKQLSVHGMIYDIHDGLLRKQYSGISNRSEADLL